MKICTGRTKDHCWPVREFGSLDECIETLIKETNVCEYVVWKKRDFETWVPDDADWVVEIYDDYRE